MRYYVSMKECRVDIEINGWATRVKMQSHEIVVSQLTNSSDSVRFRL